MNRIDTLSCTVINCKFNHKTLSICYKNNGIKTKIIGITDEGNPIFVCLSFEDESK